MTVEARTLGPHADRQAGKPRGLARRLVAARIKRAQSQHEAAAALGVHPVTWARWEAGLAEPRGLYRRAVDAWVNGGKG
mgnify:CR=1 FL=1